MQHLGPKTQFDELFQAIDGVKDIYRQMQDLANTAEEDDEYVRQQRQAEWARRAVSDATGAMTRSWEYGWCAGACSFVLKFGLEFCFALNRISNRTQELETTITSLKALKEDLAKALETMKTTV